MADEKKTQNPLIPPDDEPLSEAMQKEKERSEVPVSGKHMVPRIILFVVFLLIAIAGITFGIMGLFSSDPGLQEITYNSPSIPVSKTSSLYYYVTGNFFTASGLANSVKSTYSTLYYEAYSLYEETTAYESPYFSVGNINAAANEEIAVPDRLYADLMKAKESQSESYSLFYGPIETFWNERTSLHGADDPIGSAEARNYVESYAELYRNDDIASLEFIAPNKVKLTEKPGYKAWKEENAYDGPLLSLGILKEAYRLDYIKEGMLEKGYRDGYLLSENGSLLALGGLNGVGLNLSAMLGDIPEPALRLSLTEDSCIASIRHFPLYEEDPASYLIEEDSKLLLRSLDIDPRTGYPANSHTFAAISSSETLAQSQLKLLQATRGETNIASLKGVIYQNNDGGKTICHSASLKQRITPLSNPTGEAFQLQEIQ